MQTNHIMQHVVSRLTFRILSNVHVLMLCVVVGDRRLAVRTIVDQSWHAHLVCYLRDQLVVKQINVLLKAHSASRLGPAFRTFVEMINAHCH